MPVTPKERKVWKNETLEIHETEPEEIPSTYKFEVPAEFFDDSAIKKWPEIMLQGIFFFPNEGDYQYRRRVRRFLLSMDDDKFENVGKMVKTHANETF